MVDQKVYRAIGLMSGTSLDGVDVALIETDGLKYVRPLRSAFYPYHKALRDYARKGFGQVDIDPVAEDLITKAHINALDQFGEKADLIGFHGQTIFHDPSDGVTVQIGDGQRLADHCGVPVVYDMRSADVKAGGQGAPLLPLYHRARLLSHADKIQLPCVILNIGGVSNLTWVSGEGDDDILAMDCGPGNALMDDLVLSRMGKAYDKDGKLASKGNVKNDLVACWLGDPYFNKSAPKSLDRDYWGNVTQAIKPLTTEDALACLSLFTAKSIALSQRHFVKPALAWYVGGGGRHNKHLMDLLQESLNGDVKKVDALGWDGDGLEAEGFAYLAVRSLKGRPLTLPKTTGVCAPTEGGVLAKPS